MFKKRNRRCRSARASLSLLSATSKQALKLRKPRIRHGWMKIKMEKVLELGQLAPYLSKEACPGNSNKAPNIARSTPLFTYRITCTATLNTLLWSFIWGQRQKKKLYSLFHHRGRCVLEIVSWKLCPGGLDAVSKLQQRKTTSTDTMTRYSSSLNLAQLLALILCGAYRTWRNPCYSKVHKFTWNGESRLGPDCGPLVGEVGTGGKHRGNTKYQKV